MSLVGCCASFKLVIGLFYISITLVSFVIRDILLDKLFHLHIFILNLSQLSQQCVPYASWELAFRSYALYHFRGVELQ